MGGDSAGRSPKQETLRNNNNQADDIVRVLMAKFSEVGHTFGHTTSRKHFFFKTNFVLHWTGVLIPVTESRPVQGSVYLIEELPSRPCWVFLCPSEASVGTLHLNSYLMGLSCCWLSEPLLHTLERLLLPLPAPTPQKARWGWDVWITIAF